MKYLQKTLLTFILGLFVAGMLFAQADTRASATWQVQKYDITATLPQDEKDRNLAVKAVLTLVNVSGGPAPTLTLRISPNAAVSAISINGSTADFSKSEEKINASSSLQRLVMRFPSAAAGAVVIAIVDYKLANKENSALNVLSPTGAQFLPLSFWYPTPNSWYFARGADSAPFRVHVNSVNGNSVVSSGVETAGTFEQKLRGQPFFVASNWDSVNSSGVSVHFPRGVGAEGQKRAAELAALMSEARAFAAGLLGTSPDVPLRIISSKRAAGFSSGGAVVVDDAVFRRSKIDSQTAMAVSEAAVKLWLGNAVLITGDGHGVISEGLSRFIATQFIESKFGKDIADAERDRQRTTYASVAKRDSPLNLVSPLDDFYYPEVANKGAMVWRILARRVGQNDFYNILRANMQDGSLTLPELRAAFSQQKEILDYLFDQVTDMNLLVGLPQVSGTDTRVALRNTGGIDATVNVSAFAANGESMAASATIRATSLGEIIFKTTNKIVRVEVDTEKLYPQIEYSDDVAPNEVTDSDLLLAVKRSFDKQDFANAEKTARIVLRNLPRFDDVRILLGRSLLALGRNLEAEKEFRAVLDEKLPTSRSLAWANVGLAEVAAKAGQNDQAQKFAEAAIFAEGESGASFAARTLRNKVGAAANIDPTIKAFFADFDRVAVSNRKADVDALVLPGEVTKFASGVSGSTEQWQTQVRQIDRIDSLTVLVEVNLNIKLLNREPESGTAVFRLSKAGNGWKLSGVDMFEVR